MFICRVDRERCVIHNWYKCKKLSSLKLCVMTPLQDIERVTSLTVLGVVINDRLTAADHVSGLLTTCSRLLYTLRVLRSHGLPSSSMHDVFRSTVIARLLYCSPAWSGFCSAADRMRLVAFLRRCQRLGYCSSDTPL